MKRLMVYFQLEDSVIWTEIEVDLSKEDESDAIEKGFKKLHEKYGITFDMDECEEISVHPLD